MNIIFIGTFDTKGGAARLSSVLKNELERRGHTTHMFVHHKYGNDADVTEISQGRSERLLAKVFATDTRFWKSDQILETEAYKQADIVHLHNIHGNFFSLETLEKMSREKRIVWTLHDMWAITGHNAWGYQGFEKKFDEQNQADERIPVIEVTPPLLWDNQRSLFTYKKEIYKKIDPTIVPVSSWLENELRGSILEGKSIRMIHNGIDTSVFTPRDKATSRKKLGLPLDKKIIGFVSVGGRENIQKGWHYTEQIIEHFKHRTDVLFICIGGKEKIENSQNIFYVDYVSDPRVLADYYSAMDIFLFTSLAENFPLVTLEAMACGTAVAAFDVGGTKEGVTHRMNGYIAKYRDADDLKKGVEYLLNLSASEMQKTSQENVKKVQASFTVEKMTDAYVSLYESL